MSETILRILLEELQTARLVCKVCGTVTEIAVKELGSERHIFKCPGCPNAVFQDVDHKIDSLAKLSQAFHELAKQAAVFGVEFVIRQPEEKR